MKIKNLGDLLSKIKPYLKQYLKDSGLEFSDTHVQCPNHKNHKNQDKTPACKLNGDTHFYCFVCHNDAQGDIFNACNLLEGRPLQGDGFIKDNVLYLADKYKIPYELGEETQEELRQKTARKVLEKIVTHANSYLKENAHKEALQYITKRKWNNMIHVYNLGFIPEDLKLKAFFEQLAAKYDFLFNKDDKDTSGYLGKLKYDNIINRLIYPVYNAYGELVGISTRTIQENEKKYKYLHFPLRKFSGEKINMLFNLNIARSYERIYVVEGASSVFTLLENDINNCVALLGSSFADNHYNWLVEHGIKELVLCFDGDDAGKLALTRTIKSLETKGDIHVFIKELTDEFDPDDYINKFGVDAFKQLPEISMFKYQLNKYVETQQKEYKESLLEQVIHEQEPIIQERMLQLFAKQTELKKTTLLEELKKYKSKHDLQLDFTTAEYIEMGNTLEKAMDDFESLIWSTGDLMGVDSGFRGVNDFYDGIQSGLHLISGKWQAGKSIYFMNQTIQLLKVNQNIQILYLSIDDSLNRQTLPRFVSYLSEIPLSYVRKPNALITNNPNFNEDEKKLFIEKLNNGCYTIRGYGDRFSLLDARDDMSFDSVHKYLKICKKRIMDRGGDNLIIFIDFLYSIGVKEKDKTHRQTVIVEEIRKLTKKYDVAILGTVPSTKVGINSEFADDSQLKGESEVPHEADIITILNQTFGKVANEMYFVDPLTGEGKPIVNFSITKNKLSGKTGNLYWKLHPELMRYEEIPEEGQIFCRSNRWKEFREWDRQKE